MSITVLSQSSTNYTFTNAGSGAINYVITCNQPVAVKKNSVSQAYGVWTYNSTAGYISINQKAGDPTWEIDFPTTTPTPTGGGGTGVSCMVTFIITNHTQPLTGVSLVIGGQFAYTNLNGSAVIYLQKGSYILQVTKQGLSIYTVSVQINKTVQTVAIDISKTLYNPFGGLNIAGAKKWANNNFSGFSLLVIALMGLALVYLLSTRKKRRR
jgi:hypothetical protein